MKITMKKILLIVAFGIGLGGINYSLHAQNMTTGEIVAEYKKKIKDRFKFVSDARDRLKKTIQDVQASRDLSEAQKSHAQKTLEEDLKKYTDEIEQLKGIAAKLEIVLE